MRRQLLAHLHRRQGLVLRSITVKVLQVSLGGFTEALKAAGSKILQFREMVLQGRDMTDLDVARVLAHPDVTAAIADILCPNQPRGWFRPWHSERNILRMLNAAGATSDWGRLIGQLSLSGEGRQGRGSLFADAISVARILGISPAEVIDEWSMERFLDVCDGILRANEVAKRDEMLDDPTMNPEAEPSPLGKAHGLGGKVTIN
jgi:hypothetical protein